MAFGFANAAEAFVIRRLLMRGPRGPRLDSVEDLGRLVVATVAGALTVGVLAGLIAKVGLGGAFVPTVYAVAAAHSAAVLTVAPVSIAWLWQPARALDVRDGAQTALVVVMTVWVFWPGQSLPLVFLPLPALAWGAMRQCLRVVVLQLLAVAVLVVFLTHIGAGPFAAAAGTRTNSTETVAALTQAFVIAAAVTTLSLAVASTQRRQAVAYASKQAQFTDVVLDTAATAILVLDADGRIDRINTTAASWVGVPEQLLVGAPAADVFPVLDGRTQLAERFAHIADGAVEPVEEQIWMVPALGRRVIVWTNRYLTDELGRRTHLVKAGTDVTDARAALERERQVVAELTALDEAKTDFVSAVSHELRTPLASVIGYAEMLEDGAAGELSPRQLGLVGRIERNGQRLLELIEDLLVNARIEAGRLELDRRRCDLAAIVCSAWEGVRPLSDRRDLDLIVDLGAKPVWLQGDARALERAASNLLSNAIKFTPDGGRVEVNLTVAGDRKAPLAVLTVRDSGIGIPADDLEQVFRRFYRSKTAIQRAIQGTGLGLSIVRAIIDGHGGHITITSEVGQGTTMTVTLPALPLEPEEGGTQHEP